MGERQQHTPGTFSWVELSTPDPDAAKRFYAALFGWETEDFPMGEYGNYTIARVGGRDVGAISPQPSQQRDAGLPPHWASFITVESADRTLERVPGLGGEVHAGPFDVMDSGRMGVVQDPQGAFFMVWEPRQHIGAGLVNAPGALCWNELASPDPQGSIEFYSELFGWSFTPFEGTGMEYYVIMRPDERSNGGVRSLVPGEEMAHWLAYFAVDDLESALAQVTAEGGERLTEVMPIGTIARFAVIQDPEGAVLALYAGRLDD